MLIWISRRQPLVECLQCFFFDQSRIAVLHDLDNQIVATICSQNVRAESRYIRNKFLVPPIFFKICNLSLDRQVQRYSKVLFNNICENLKIIKAAYLKTLQSWVEKDSYSTMPSVICEWCLLCGNDFILDAPEEENRTRIAGQLSCIVEIHVVMYDALDKCAPAAWKSGLRQWYHIIKRSVHKLELL